MPERRRCGADAVAGGRANGERVPTSERKRCVCGPAGEPREVGSREGARKARQRRGGKEGRRDAAGGAKGGRVGWQKKEEDVWTGRGRFAWKRLETRRRRAFRRGPKLEVRAKGKRHSRGATRGRSSEPASAHPLRRFEGRRALMLPVRNSQGGGRETAGAGTTGRSVAWTARAGFGTPIRRARWGRERAAAGRRLRRANVDRLSDREGRGAGKVRCHEGQMCPATENAGRGAPIGRASAGRPRGTAPIWWSARSASVRKTRAIMQTDRKRAEIGRANGEGQATSAEAEATGRRA